MLSLSPIKLLVIVAVVVLLLGPDKLPEVAQTLGRWWQTLRRFQQRVESEVRDIVPDLPTTNDLARITRSPMNFLNELADRASGEESPLASSATSPLTDSPPLVERPRLNVTPPATSDPSLN